MIIGVPAERLKDERRVALIPEMVQQLTRKGFQVLVESQAGERASFQDDEYHEAGAEIVTSIERLYGEIDILVKVNPPALRTTADKHELLLLSEGKIVIGFLSPLNNPELLEILINRGQTAFALEFIPRITRAQNMDALSSMATVAGYKAVLVAAERLDKFFPLLMTAAGTVVPANVLVLGAGVAGLQAIATARRLGARVEAFDPRPAVKEQVESLGANFVEMELPEDAETEGGYARDLGEEFLLKEREAIASRLANVDVVVTTAQIFGKKAPVLITEEMVEIMRPGAIIVDLGAEQGGNCELTKPGETIFHKGVQIIGPQNLPASVPYHASQLYARNITNLILHLFPEGAEELDFEDEITRKTCIIKSGEIINPMVKEYFHSHRSGKE